MFKGLFYGLLFSCFFLPLPLALAQTPRASLASQGMRHEAPILSFHENSALTLPLSRIDLNRITVIGDKILDVQGGTAFYNVNNDGSGAVLLTFSVDHPFTLYIQTAKGHHFSLLVIPQKVPGRTIVFKPIVSGDRSRLATQHHQNELTVLTRAMLARSLPRGYRYRAMHDAWHPTGKLGNITPVGRFTGHHLTGWVLVFQNRTDHTLHLKPSDFSKPQTRSLAFSSQRVQPGDEILIYRIDKGADHV